MGSSKFNGKSSDVYLSRTSPNLSMPEESLQVPLDSLFDGWSRLSPRLQDVLSDPEALQYFIEFMESRNVLHLLRFWIDSEQFCRVCSEASAGASASATTEFPNFVQPNPGLSRDWEYEQSSGYTTADPITSTSPVHQHRRDEVYSPTASVSAGNHSSTRPQRPSDFCVSFQDSERFEKDIQDNALKIYRHYISIDAEEPVGVEEDMRRDILVGMCPENGHVALDCFQPAQDAVLKTLKDRYFVEFLHSCPFLRYKCELALSDRMSLADILNDNHALAFFVEFMEQEDKLHLVGFVLSGVQFQSQWKWKDANGIDEQAKLWSVKDAMMIYDKHISMQAEQKVILNDPLRIRTEEKICREEGPAPDCFYEAVCSVYHLISAVYLPAYCTSQFFLRYLVEIERALKHAMELTGEDPAVKRKSRHVTVTRRNRTIETFSEETVSVRSEPLSLQKMELRLCDNPESGQANNCVASVSNVSSIATGDRASASSEYGSSADLAGTVRRLKRMTLGEVDALGRFVSFAEAEPLGNPDGFLSRSLKKLSSTKEQRRSNEEAALEAQRIIEDTLLQAKGFIIAD